MMINVSYVMRCLSACATWFDDVRCERSWFGVEYHVAMSVPTYLFNFGLSPFPFQIDPSKYMS